jgi:hypothetical protein
MGAHGAYPPFSVISGPGSRKRMRDGEVAPATMQLAVAALNRRIGALRFRSTMDNGIGKQHFTHGRIYSKNCNPQD